jgi:threonine synthase
VAGVIKLAKKGYFKRGTILVCVLTGHGLKDPDRVIRMIRPPKVVKPTLSAILAELDL